MTLPKARYRKSSWAAGLLVLGGLAWTLWTLLVTAQGPEKARGLAADSLPSQELVTSQEPESPELPPVPAERILDGVVRFPSGTPAPGVTVIVHRAETTAPEWQRVQLSRAITGPTGTFHFELAERHGLLIEFSHTIYAGDLVEVPEVHDRLDLDLRPGFELSGMVIDSRGKPLGGVRVAVETTLEQSRRARWVMTTANGGYRFTKLPAGLVRLVARHPRWQEVGTSVLIGSPQNYTLRFTTPATAPFGGRVVTPGQVPIADAVLELVPNNGRLGLVDPITAVSASDGTFIMNGLSRGPMSLLVRHRDYGTLRRTVAVGTSAGDTVLELPPRSRVTGRVGTNEVDGEPGLGVPELALQVTDTAGEIHQAKTDADGMFAFDRPMSPGRATVVMHGGEYAFVHSQSLELGLQVEEEAETIWDLVVTTPSRVSGRCVDAEGAPLPGVEVVGTKQLTASRLIGSNLASFIGTFGQDVALTLGSERDSLLAVTGADGKFTFTAQEPGSLLLRYALDGRARRRLRIVVPPAGTAAELEDVVMPRGCRIAGVVRRGRQPLAGATVTIVGSESQSTVTTRNGGRFDVDDLMAGTYRVRARLPSMPAGVEETVEVSLDAITPRLTLDLPPGRTVEGLVTGRDGQPVANALVSVRGGAGLPTLTDARGSFSLELPTSTVELQVSLNDKSHSRTETVRPEQNNVNIQLDAPPTGTLVCRIAGLPGRTRVPAVLLLVKRKIGSSGEDRPRWVEVQNGELRWPLCPVGLCRIEIRCEGFAPLITEHEFVANEEHDLGEILLERGAWVSGVVVDAAGTPVPNARVFVGDEADLDIYEPQVVSGADGTFVVRGISSRSSALVAYAAGYSPSERQLALPGDVLSGRPVELTLEPGAVISVEVANAPESGLVQLLRGGRLLASAVLDEAGQAEFVDRGPGRYSVRLYGSESAPKRVEIDEPGKSVRVVLD